MPVLGRDGILELSREWPDPLALRSSTVNINLSLITFNLQNQSYWTGDRVWIAAAGGVPIDVNGDGYADTPDGHGIYRGSIYLLGPARGFYLGAETNENGPHYQVSDSVAYYNTAATTGLTTIISAYIYRDPLDRIRIYSTQIDAFNNTGVNEILIKKVDSGNFVITPYSTFSGYQAAVNTTATAIFPLELDEDEQRLSDLTTLPAAFAEASSSPEARGWLFQGSLKEWALDIDASKLDMTSIGETFGEATKALVRGAGSMTFLFDHTAVAQAQDPLALLRLVLLTQDGSRAAAKFYLMKDRIGSSSGSIIGGTIYYETTILLSGCRMNLRATDLVEGSADFVVTGEIALRAQS